VQVEFSKDGERLIARPQGRMEADDGADFVAATVQRLGATKAVTIDLDELDFVGLGAIRAILRLARSLRGDQRTLDFAGGSHVVREALDQAGFHHFFAFTPPHVPTHIPNRGIPR
jgi:anti-anti-sigma regulatory factor